MSGWRNATPKHPCSICGRPDWCRYTEDGAVQDCYRQGDASAVERQDINGAPFWRHRSGSSLPIYRRQDIPLPPSTERAGVRDLDRVYRALLGSLPLDSRHRSGLQVRGFSDADITRRGYRSLLLPGRYSVVKELIQQFGQDLIGTVPGFIQREGESATWYWTLGGPPGLLVPVRNIDGAITGMVVRCDNPGDGGKYRWLSSRHAGGPSPEMVAHVPLHAGDSHPIRVTEGPLKADVATALSGVLTLGLPGCGQWKLALPVLEQRQSELILLAWDADWRDNAHVARSLCDCAKHLHNSGFNCKVEDWHPSEGKGIDDLLVNGHEPQQKPWMYALVCKHRGTARKIGKGVANGR